MKIYIVNLSGRRQYSFNNAKQMNTFIKKIKNGVFHTIRVYDSTLLYKLNNRWYKKHKGMSLSPEKIRQLIKDHEKTPVRQLVKKYKISHQAIINILRKHHVTIRQPGFIAKTEKFLKKGYRL